MATVDEEEHAVLDRLTFDYHQKLQGKPQSHELVGATRPGVQLVLSLLGVLRVPTCEGRALVLRPVGQHGAGWGRVWGGPITAGPAPLCRRCTRC